MSSELTERLTAIGGCGDGNCKVIVRGGMHTNGGCRCLSKTFTAERVVYALKAEIKRLTVAERIGTHGPGCWAWGPQHYECAVREINAAPPAPNADEGVI